MTNEESTKAEEPEYPRNEEVMWKVPRDGRQHIDHVLLAEAKKRFAPQLADNEQATPVGQTSIIEHHAHEIDGRMVDPVAENVTIYAQLFTVEAKDPGTSSEE
ncbi:hypothetical protein WMO79_20120 [Micrococcaceae bacterium Sec7.4]